MFSWKFKPTKAKPQILHAYTYILLKLLTFALNISEIWDFMTIENNEVPNHYQLYQIQM